MGGSLVSAHHGGGLYTINLSEHAIGWDELHRDTRRLAARLMAERLSFTRIVGIARGGLVPATILARELEVRFVDTLCIASYDHTRRGEIEVLKDVEGDGEGMLVIDDLSDTGRTLNEARQMLPKAHFATVYVKPLGKGLVDSYVTEVPQNVWLHFPWDMTPIYTAPLALGEPA